MCYEEQKMRRLLPLAALVVVIAGCASAPPTTGNAPAEIVLEKNTVRLEGWFSARGEWMVSPISGGIEDFNPLEKPPNQRCVSVVNDTGVHRSEFAALDGKRVIAIGFVMNYYDVPVGPSYVDRITEKRYYKDEVVFNSCLRDEVFIASHLHLSDRQ